MGILFENQLFEEFGMRALQHAVYGGSDFGECFTTARAIEGDDVDRYYQAWLETGDRIFAIADASAASGHSVSAREAYLRASTYYRTSYFPLYGRPIDPRLREAFAKEKLAFDRAARLMDPAGEPLEIPYEGTTLPGYLFTVDDSGRPRKTLVCTNGYDSTIYEMYFGHAVAALRRGYNVLLFDGPGQGRALFEQDLYMRSDWEQVVRPVVDYALTRPEIDPERLALLGWSFGGYLAPRAATGEHRIKALIADPGQWDLGEAMRNAIPWPEGQAEKFPEVDRDAVQPVLDQMMHIPHLRWSFEQRAFMVHGIDSLYDYFKLVMAYTVAPIAGQIDCPTLITWAENDPIAGYAEQLYDALACDKTLIRFLTSEGAGDHCEANARTLYHQRVYDWLDDHFG